MRLRPILVTTTAILAAAAVGVGGGYAAGRMDKPSPGPPPHPAALGSVAPLPADPELEVAKSIPYMPDTDYPPLPINLSYSPKTARGGGHVWSYSVPTGWTGDPGDQNDPKGTVRWRPADETPEDRGYLLRIAPISGRDSPSDEVETQKRKMLSNYRDVRVLRQSDDTIWFVYRTNDNYRRFNYFAWVPVPGTNLAGFELSVAGRVADQAGTRGGLQDLLEKVKGSVKLRRS